MKKIIKVCFIAPIPPICKGINIPTTRSGGIATWMLQVWRYIFAGKTNVQMCYVDISTKKRTVEGSRLWDRIVVSGISMLSIKSELNNAIKTYSPDVVHLTTSGSLGVIRDILLINIARKKDIPVIYHLRFGRMPEIAKAKNWEFKLISMAIKQSSATIVIDKQSHYILKCKIPNVDIYHVPNLLDISNLPEPIKNKSKEIVFLGWVIKAKGIEELLSAWQQISDKHDGWTLRIIGPYAQSYKEYLDNNFSMQAVSFDGEKSHYDALKIVSESEIFILPSHTEGFPNSMLEAMALKKAIIATDVGAIADMLEGDCGILIKPQSVRDIERALLNLMYDSELRHRLGNKAFTKVMNEYTIDKIFEEYELIWRKSINR